MHYHKLTHTRTKWHTALSHYLILSHVSHSHARPHSLSLFLSLFPLSLSLARVLSNPNTKAHTRTHTPLHPHARTHSHPYTRTYSLTHTALCARTPVRFFTKRKKYSVSPSPPRVTNNPSPPPNFVAFFRARLLRFVSSGSAFPVKPRSDRSSRQSRNRNRKLQLRQPTSPANVSDSAQNWIRKFFSPCYWFYFSSPWKKKLKMRVKYFTKALSQLQIAISDCMIQGSFSL